MVNDWGPSTWIMLHTLAEKIKIEYFASFKNELWKHILNICLNLPCPVCAKHAREYLSQVNHSQIKSKEDIQLILYMFNNNVNKHLNKDDFPKDQVNDKYAAENTHQVVHNFINRFSIASSRGMAFNNSLMAKHALSTFQNWYSTNYHIFEK